MKGTRKEWESLPVRKFDAKVEEYRWRIKKIKK
jgi:hypothetical protein